MTIHEALIAHLPTVTFDLYRDIHKGIRAELFTVTATAIAAQARDTGCTALTINQTAVKTPATCWAR